MTRRSLSLLFLIANVVFPNVAGAQTAPQPRKLIEFGWDEPDPAFLRQHIAEMEKSPFDGTVFHAHLDFLWQGWSKRRFSQEELAPAIADLKQTSFRKFRHNFLRFNATPGDVDWFDDFAPVVDNARLAAKIAKVGGAAGVLFDIEQYNAQPFNYSKQRGAATRTWDAYASKARQRGREMMSAFQAEFPDLVLFMTWSYSLPFQQADGDERSLAKIPYGLLKPFLDGLFEAARGKTKIVDGFETSYGYKEARRFDDVRRKMKQTVLPWMPSQERYLKHSSLAFGLWMDDDWRKVGWNEMDHSRNHFTPAQFEAALKKALATSDEYVWIYTETPRWWTQPAGKPAKLPIEYDQAVRRAVGRD